MDTQFLVTLSQQMAADRTMEVIANNLANASTPSFKRESALFEKYMMPMQTADGDGTNGVINVAYVVDKGVSRDLTEGTMEATNAPLDFAITGNGYFVVSTPNGERYTRDGHFALDGQGKLVTEDGYAVQSDGGEITLTPNDGDIIVSSDGTISSEQGQLGKLRLVSFDNESALKKTGSNLYQTDQTAQSAQSNVRVHQGMIEKSNVQPVIEISRMIEVMRAYQSGSDVIQTGQDLLKQTIEKLGQMPQG